MASLVIKICVSDACKKSFEIWQPVDPAARLAASSVIKVATISAKMRTFYFKLSARALGAYGASCAPAPGLKIGRLFARISAINSRNFGARFTPFFAP